MKPCPFCAEEIQDQAVKCRFCGEFLEKSSPEKWYFKTTWVVLALFSAGPLALPLIWFHPKYSLMTKWAISLGVICLSVILGMALSQALKALEQYYQIIFSY